MRGMAKLSTYSTAPAPLISDKMPITSGGATYGLPLSSIPRTVTKIVAPSGYTGVADYACDGTADDADINLAITAVSGAGGGIVLLLPGTYNIAASINMSSNISLRGSGWATILKTANSTNIHTISISSDDNLHICDLQIDGNKANNASQTGHLIRLDTANNILLENLYVHDSGLHGIISNTAVTNLRIVNCRTESNGVTSNGSGVYLNGTTNAVVHNLITTGNQLDGLQWKTSDKILISNIISYSNSRCGIYAIDGHADINNINLYSNGTIGLSIENSGLSNTTVNVSSGEIYSSGNDGIRVTTSDACGFNNLRVYNNATGATGAGLHLRATNGGETCNRHRISNCSFFDNQGSPTQEYGIWTNGSGTVDRNVVIGNLMYGNGSAAFQQDTWGANNVYSASNNVTS
jgi:hypothetical protein